MRLGLWFSAIMVCFCMVSLAVQSPARAQEAEEKAIVVAPEEGQKAETPAPAAAPKEKAEALEKIVVTATKTERNPDDVPASITVITKEDIRKQNIQTVDEAISNVPGAFNRRGKGWGDTTMSVNLRGFPADNQKRTLVLLDGQDISNSYTNQVGWTSLPVENIERIEVIRGPFSALYGGSAMGGVINIITKTPKKLEMVAQGGYGTYDSWTYYLGAGDRLWDKVSITGGFNYRISTGYPTSLVTKTASNITNLKKPPATNVVGWQSTRTPTGGVTNIIGDSGDNNWNDYSFNGKISWDITPGHKVTFSTLQTWYDYGYDMYHSYLRNAATGAQVTSGTVRLSDTNQQFSSLTAGAFCNGDGRRQTGIYNLTSDHQITETTKLKFHAGLVNQPTNYYTTPSSSSALTTFGGGPGTVSSTPSKNWVAELQVDQAIGKKQQLVGGLAFNTGWASNMQYNLYNWRSPEGLLNRTQVGGGRDRTIGVYIQDEIAWHPKFITVIGVRLDRWETYGGNYMSAAGQPIQHLPSRSQTAVSPKIAFLYRPLEWMTWRASAGRAFRAPNVYELYATWTSSTGTIYKSNPDLKPETCFSWEIGTTLKPFKGNTITATFFENYVYDLIYRTNDPSDPTGKTQNYYNAAQARIRGVEIEIKQKFWSWLEVFGNTTLTDPRITENPYNPFTEGKNLTYSPRQQFNCGVTATYWKIQAYLAGRYVSKIQSSDENNQYVNGVYTGYDPFFTLDSKIIFSPVKYVDMSFAVDNILNREYYYYYRSPGRTIWSMLTLKY
jgi:iron complex outermembrane receptor protein